MNQARGTYLSTPDFVTLGNGLEATRRIGHESPSTKMLMLSMYTNEEYLREALRAGAAGYLLKDAGRNELEFAIKAVSRGETYLTPVMAKLTVNSSCRHGMASTSPLARLTGRQREVLQLVAEGCSTKQIAQRLKLSVKTIETHRAQLMERLDIHDVGPGRTLHVSILRGISVEDKDLT